MKISRTTFIEAIEAGIYVAFLELTVSQTIQLRYIADFASDFGTSFRHRCPAAIVGLPERTGNMFAVAFDNRWIDDWPLGVKIPERIEIED